MGCRVPESCPQAIADLWEACTKTDPDERPSAMEVQECLQDVLRVMRQGVPPFDEALTPFQPVPVDSFVLQVTVHPNAMHELH